MFLAVGPCFAAWPASIRSRTTLATLRSAPAVVLLLMTFPDTPLSWAVLPCTLAPRLQERYCSTAVESEAASRFSAEQYLQRKHMTVRRRVSASSSALCTVRGLIATGATALCNVRAVRDPHLAGTLRSAFSRNALRLRCGAALATRLRAVTGEAQP